MMPLNGIARVMVGSVQIVAYFGGIYAHLAKFRDDMEKRSRANGRRVQTVKGLRVQLDEDALPYDPALTIS